MNLFTEGNLLGALNERYLRLPQRQISTPIQRIVRLRPRRDRIRGRRWRTAGARLNRRDGRVGVVLHLPLLFAPVNLAIRPVVRRRRMDWLRTLRAAVVLLPL